LLQHNFSIKFITGIVLIVLNPLIAWAGLLYCTYLAKKTCKRSYFTVGACLYALSWLMAITGLLLAGKDGIDLIKPYFNRFGSIIFLVTLLVIAFSLYSFIKTSKSCNH
jgi:hypothetical protein